MRRKRDNGEGTIYRRKDGRWAGGVQVGFVNGRRAMKVVYGKSRSEVLEKVRELLESARRGTIAPGRSPRLDTFLNQWLQTIEGSIRPSTFTSYSGIVRKHLIPVLGHKPIDRLTVPDIADLLARKRGEGLSPRTGQYILFVLRNALNKAVRWGIASRNVAQLVDAPRVAHRDVNVLSPEEALQLVTAAREDRLEALWVLALSTGLRRGELLGLSWSDIDLERRQLRVTKALQRVTGKGLVLAETKTRMGRRSIILPIGTVEALRRHRARQAGDRLIAGSAWSQSDFVFTSARGTPLDGDNMISRPFTRLLERGGLQAMRFHDLRHSCASLLLAQGVAPRVVMETLGHSRISVTLDTYTHVLPALQREAADAMDRALAPSLDP
ncbi:MAG TPA: tyrosine-type recombinase/integrase [Candidatus Dormibacteraeota bacterium]|nr:tyrosine-type recombinase/integrase [Candidatus Dormibacteraeota bacterium]